MKTTLPFAILLAVTTGLSAQITVTNATFPAAGDMLRMNIDNSPGTIGSITPPGQQNWDFTGLTVDSTFNIIYRPASEGSVDTLLTEATLFTSLVPSTEEYYRVTPTTVEQVAYYGPDWHGLVLANALFRYSPPVTERWAPLNFFDIHQTSSGILRGFQKSEILPSFIALFPNQPDSLRFRVALSRLEAVEAFGSLSIPGGTFDVLRVKRTEYRESRLDGKFNPLGWLDITDLAVLGGVSGFGVDTTVSYIFYNDVAKEPIAVVTLDNNQAFATQIVFKNTAAVNGLEEVDAAMPSVKISPNPVSGEAVFDFNNFVQGSYRLAIFDETGRLVLEKNKQVSGGQTERIDLSPLPAGVYFFSVFDENGRAVCREKLVKM